MAVPDVPVSPEEEEALPDMEMPTPEKLMEILREMDGISEEDREELLQELLSRQQHMPGVGQSAEGLFSNQALMLLTLLSIVAFIFVFFGYKLYKSLKEKERKRDEKRKMKQQKKKK